MQQKYEKWLWLELIGFELDAADLGVGAYLERLGFTPTGLSLLITSLNFIHLHDRNNWEKQVFPPEYCSYGAHNVNGERHRQVWTGAKLKQLVDELHQHRIEVCFAVFDYCIEQKPAWLEQHREISYIDRQGQEITFACVWKRFNDGSYYEDFFVAKLDEVMRDYGFNGFHAADGLAHPRLPIYVGDFSNDMIDQFVTSSGVQIPRDIFNPGLTSAVQTRRIAKWILRHHALDWRQFYVRRITAFWAKVVRCLKSMGKWMIYNSAWTRDPFEAIYRYGIDYRALYEAGVTKYIVELAGPALELENWGAQEPRTLYSRMASTLLFRAYVPDAKLVFLNGIRDFNEQYLLLQHAPALFESEIISQFNLFHLADNNALTRCQDGVLACLADGLSREEWRKINDGWECGTEFQPETIGGAVLLYSGKHLYQQLAGFMNDRRWYDYRLLTHLLSYGAPIHAVTQLGNLTKIKQPVVILNPELWDAAELEQVAACQDIPIICIGCATRELPFHLDPIITEHHGDASPMYCGVLNAKKHAGLAPAPTRFTKKAAAKPPVNLKDPASWLDDLYVPGLTKGFLRACAELITGCSRHPQFQCVPGETKVEILSKGDVSRLIISNDRKHYDHVTITSDRPVKQVDYVSGFKFCEIMVDGNAFRLKLPPAGMLMADVTLYTALG